MGADQENGCFLFDSFNHKIANWQPKQKGGKGDTTGEINSKSDD
jgi:hypothetical protein